MGRRVSVCFDTSSTLRRVVSAKLINRVRSSSLPLQTDIGAEAGEMRPVCFLLPLTAAAAASAVASSSHGDVSEYVVVGEDEVPPLASAWSRVPVRDEIVSSTDGVFDAVGGALVRAAGAVSRTARSLTWSPPSSSSAADDDDTASLRHRRSFTTDRDDAAGTVFHAIRASGRGRRFAELLGGHEMLRDMLDDPGREVTVFLPADDAVRRLEGLLRRVGEGGVREMLEYHVLPGAAYPVEALRGVRTVDTVLEESGMGRRQRIRVEEGVEGVEVNFYARVLGDESIRAANGIVHFLDDVLVPPPRHDKLIAALPERLSVFSAALRRTGVSSGPRGTVTVFAPSDEAWAATLGAEATGFLFSDEGAAYLEALVGYHVVAGEVVYSDAGTGEEEEEEERELETLLPGAGVVVVKRGGTGAVVVDGMEVEVRDVPARDGVVHVLGRVLVPGGRGEGDGRMGVGEIRERLGRFVRVEEEEEGGFESGEL